VEIENLILERNAKVINSEVPIEPVVMSGTSNSENIVVNPVELPETVNIVVNPVEAFVEVEAAYRTTGDQGGENSGINKISLDLVNNKSKNMSVI
jgi:hypothetical protein